MSIADLQVDNLTVAGTMVSKKTIYADVVNANTLTYGSSSPALSESTFQFSTDTTGLAVGDVVNYNRISGLVEKGFTPYGAQAWVPDGLGADDIRPKKWAFLSDDTFLLTWTTFNTSVSGIVHVTFDPSTGNCTFGTPLTLTVDAASSSQEVGVAVIDQTRAIVVYGVDPGSADTLAQIVSIDGSTLTANATAIVNNSLALSKFEIVMVPDLSGAILLDNRSTADLYYLGISGTTVTPGTAVSTIGTDPDAGSVYIPSVDRYFFVTDTGSLLVQLSGTNVSVIDSESSQVVSERSTYPSPSGADNEFIQITRTFEICYITVSDDELTYTIVDAPIGFGTADNFIVGDYLVCSETNSTGFGVYKFNSTSGRFEFLKFLNFNAPTTTFNNAFSILSGSRNIFKFASTEDTFRVQASRFDPNYASLLLYKELRPVGIVVRVNSAAQIVEVSRSGTFNPGDGSLKPGFVYFSDTTGELTPAPGGISVASPFSSPSVGIVAPDGTLLFSIANQV